MRVFLLILNISFTMLNGWKSSAQLITYPAASNITEDNGHIYPSKIYDVSLIHNKKTIQDFVYCIPATHTTNNSKNTSWVNFSFEGKVKVTIHRKGEPIQFAQVLPRSSSIDVEILNDSTITFEITKPGHFSVEFEESLLIAEPLLIFANPLEQNRPEKIDSQTIWFGPGLHEIGDDFQVQSGQTIYIEGGAYIKGQINGSDLQNVRICGRGIISGEDYDARTHNHMINLNNAKNIEVEGITLIHSPRFMIVTRGSDHYLHNLKMMGWWFSTDGISAGENTLIENCFFKVNDDAVKLYSSNTVVRNCTIWQLENGAPFMISWNGNKDFSGCRVYNIDIIRVEHHWDNENLAVVCAVHGGKANISDFIFEDMRIDHSAWRMFHLVTRPNRWGKWDPSSGSISNLTFRNINYFGEPKIPNLIMGHDQNHQIWDIHFENILINGKKITELGRPYFIVDKETTDNISIK